MNLLGIIPARKGSKRVPDKNFRLLAGKPLFTYIAEAALGSKRLNDVVLNTDHDDIIAYSQKHYPSIIVLKRPEVLSQDMSPAIDYVTHTLQVLGEKGKHYDGVVILQPSSPLTLPGDIDSTIDLLISSGADTAVSIVKLDHMVHPVKLKMLDHDKLLPFLKEEDGKMAAHELPDVYVRNCAVYATLMRCIEEGKIIGDDCRGFIMPPERSVDINEMIDFEFVEFLLAKSKFN